MTPKEKQAKAVEEMNARVGYDVPLCFATLNTIVINTERKMGEIPLIEKRTAMAVVCEVIANAHGGVVTGEWWLLGVPFFSTTIGRLLSQ